ncbi:MAG: S8 family serine peptidase [Saprospiraceae bacterium]
MISTNKHIESSRDLRPITKRPTNSWILPFIEFVDTDPSNSLDKPIRIGHLDTGIHGEAKDILGRLDSFVAFNENGVLEENPNYEDAAGHGTRIASLLVSQSRSRMYIGVAPEAKLVSAKVLEGGATVIRILKGLNWLADQKVPIALFCVGLPNKNPVFSILLQQLRAENILAICSIGNAGNGYFFQPGDDPSVLSVGAIDKKSKVPKFSGSRRGQFSTEVLAPDILAPGVAVPCATKSGGRAPFNGTSMAAAIVAGVAAKLLAAEPESTADQLYDALCYGSGHLSAENKKHARCGILNFRKALEYLKKHKNEKPKPRPIRPVLEDAGWRDTRLMYRLAHAKSNELVVAIYIWGLNITVENWEEKARSFIDKTIPESLFVKTELLPRGRAIIISSQPKSHSLLLSSNEIIYASAADAGRALLK